MGAEETKGEDGTSQNERARKAGGGLQKAMSVEEEDEMFLLKSSFGVLKSLVGKDDKAREFVEKNHVKEALLPFLSDDADATKRTFAIMCLSLLARDDEHESIVDSGTVPFMMEAADRSPGNDLAKNFTVAEIGEALLRIAGNDRNKKKITEAGALPSLVHMLRSKAEEKQETAARLVWSLSFDPDARKRLAVEPGCVEALEDLSRSRNPAVKRQASGALWKLGDEEKKHLEKAQDEEKTDKSADGHIMISYNWADQPMILQIKDRLKAEGYNVWIDVEQMEGSTLDSMALAVENAACVLVGVSEKYKLSPNCRTEGEYTFQLKKPFIPLMMERGYKPDGWLGMLCGTQMYVNFDGKYEFDYAFNLLLDQLSRTLGTDESDSEVVRSRAATVTTSQPSDSFRHWSQRQVRKWLVSNKLSGSSHLFLNMDGENLYQFCQMKAQAPEFYFSHLANKEEMKLMDILKLSTALEKLPP